MAVIPWLVPWGAFGGECGSMCRTSRSGRVKRVPSIPSPPSLPCPSNSPPPRSQRAVCVCPSRFCTRESLQRASPVCGPTAISTSLGGWPGGRGPLWRLREGWEVSGCSLSGNPMPVPEAVGQLRRGAVWNGRGAATLLLSHNLALSCCPLRTSPHTPPHTCKPTLVPLTRRGPFRLPIPLPLFCISFHHQARTRTPSVASVPEGER